MFCFFIRIAAPALLFFISVFSNGYAEDASLISAIQGLWRSTDSKETPTVLRIDNDAIQIDDEQNYYTVLSIRDGRVVARIAGMDEILFVATSLDNDTVDLYFPEQRNNRRFGRIYEMALDDIFGWWAYRDNSYREGFINISDGFIQEPGREGEPINIELHHDEARLFPRHRHEPPIIFKSGERGTMFGSIQGKNDIIVTLVRPTSEEVAKIQTLKEAAEAEALNPMIANERNAVQALKMYATAQVTFQIGRQGRTKTNTRIGPTGFADNFRNLFYGEIVGRPESNLALIGKELADAFAGPAEGIATADKPIFSQDKPQAFYGYLFLEPAAFDFTTSFALVAYPERPGMTGANIFWIDEQGEIWFMSPGKYAEFLSNDDILPPFVTENMSPRNAPELWSKYDPDNPPVTTSRKDTVESADVTQEPDFSESDIGKTGNSAASTIDESKKRTRKRAPTFKKIGTHDTQLVNIENINNAVENDDEDAYFQGIYRKILASLSQDKMASPSSKVRGVVHMLFDLNEQGEIIALRTADEDDAPDALVQRAKDIVMNAAPFDSPPQIIVETGRLSNIPVLITIR